MGAASVDTCNPCGTGTYQQSAGSTDCDECGTGKFSDSIGAASIDTCTLCAAGTFSASQGVAQCEECDPGYVSSLPGATMCMMCDSGLYSLDNRIDCAPCTIGTYCSMGLSIECDSFRQNTHNLVAGSSSSASCFCKGGWHVSSVGSTLFCAACLENTFCLDTTQTVQDCPTTTQSVAMSTSVEDCVCRVGYTGIENSENCNACALGTYKQSIGPEVCTDCGAGKFSAQTARSLPNCDPCPKGTASSQLTASACVPCAMGEFSNALGALICSECNPGEVSSSEGAETCAVCETGKYAAEDRINCENCPPTRIVNKVS